LFASSTVKYLRFFPTIGLAGAMSFYPGKIDKGDESNHDPSEKLAQPLL
jgi:hypothetical protein